MASCAAGVGRTEALAAAALAAGILGARALAAATLDPLADEAYHWTWSTALALGYHDQPPLSAWAIAAGELVLGHGPLGARIVGLLGAALGCAALAPFARDPGTFVRLFLGLPALAFLSTLAVPDASLIAAWALCTACALRGGRWWWAAGVFGGLAALAKHDGLLVFPALWLAAPERRSRDPVVGAGLLALVVAPHVAWLAAHGAAPVVFQARENLWHPAPPGLWGPARVLAEQVGLALGLPALAWGAAVIRAVRSGDRVDHLLVASSAPVVIAFLAVSPLAPPEAHWPAPAWVAGSVLVARAAGRWVDVGALGSWLALFATIALGVHARHPLAVWPHDPGVRFTEGRALADAVAREVLPEGVGPWEPAATEVSDVFTERYQEAAFVAWHTGVPARVYPTCGRRSELDLRGAPPDAVWFVRPLRSGPPTCVRGTAGRGRVVREHDGFGRPVPPFEIFRLEQTP